jgi:hypothetical protein
MSDITTPLQALFNSHGIDTIPLDQKFLLVTKQLATVRTNITQQEFPTGFSSRLDLVFTIKGRELIECFGDVGETREEAIANNLQNFAQNSLHVIVGALQDAQEDEQITIEEWEINGHSWQVFCGNYGMKSSGGQPLQLPSELFSQLEAIIKALPLTQDYHWFRFFFACNDSEISAIEFLHDNEMDEAAEQQMSELPWQLTPDFYSVRLFLMLKRHSSVD